MSELRQLRGTPNILIVGSKSIYLSEKDYRQKLRQYLYDQTEATSPVYKGSHDFWVTYPAPVLPGHGPNHSWEDMDVGPRPLRGIVEMGDIPLRDVLDSDGGLYRKALADEMDTLQQELGHHWLVPADLKFRTPRRGDLPVAKNYELVRALNRGSWPLNPALLGRDNSHWSVFMQTEDSPFDGQNYKQEEPTGERATWIQTQHTQPRIRTSSTSDTGALTIGSAYSDVDLHIMGLLDEDKVNQGDTPSGRVAWMQPRWTNPLEYMVGLFVRFGDEDYYYFGFNESENVIAVRSTKGDRVQMNLPVHDYPIANNGMVLRVVREGNTYYFQARPDHAYATPEHDTVHHLFEELNFLPNPDPIAGWEHFRTIAKWERADTPEAIGLMVRKWEHPFLVEGRFFNFEVRDANGRQGWRFENLPTLKRGTVDYSALTERDLFYHRPASGPIARTVNHRLYLNAPFSTVKPDNSFTNHPHFDIRLGQDRMPRIAMRPADGDFVFGSSVNVSRTIMTPWAGGSIVGKRMTGEVRSLIGENIIIPDNIRAKQSPPPDNTYRVAFIVVVQDADKIEDTFIEHLDIVRRYWDATFYATTRHRRRMYSRLRRVARS